MTGVLLMTHSMTSHVRTIGNPGGGTDWTQPVRSCVQGRRIAIMPLRAWKSAVRGSAAQRASIGALVAATSLAGCTAISWQDAAGVRYHAGLVAVERAELDGACRVRCYAAGLHLDLSSDSACAVGFDRMERVVVEETVVRDPESLLAAYSAARIMSPPDPCGKARWSFCFVRDEDSSRGATVSRVAVGAGFSDGPALRGLFAGCASGAALDPHVVGNSSVLYASARRGYDPLYRLWRLEP